MYRHPDTCIEVHDLRKQFQVPVRGAGLKAAIASVIKREQRTVTAVDDVTFTVRDGEFVAFLGSNGAGKTTTLKMLAGLLHPTGGTATIHGMVPGKRQPALLSKLALVMGQRSQLIWDLPAVDSFEVQRAIYRIDRATYRQRVDEFVELLDIGEVIRKPVRALSLGERMKCELCVALLHGPTVLFLDEPTIGLDTVMQRRIRAFLRRYNREMGATVLLTSHYMADVEELCERVIAIDRGSVVFDGSLDHLATEYASHKTITAHFAHGETVERQVDRADVAEVTAELLQSGNVIDLAIEDPPIEDLIESVYNGARSSRNKPALHAV